MSVLWKDLVSNDTSVPENIEIELVRNIVNNNNNNNNKGLQIIWLLFKIILLLSENIEIFVIL